jgi:hypothetical protein
MWRCFPVDGECQMTQRNFPLRLRWGWMKLETLRKSWIGYHRITCCCALGQKGLSNKSFYWF